LALDVQSIALGGASPGAFQICPAAGGRNNCAAGTSVSPFLVNLQPPGFCYIGIDVAAGAPALANALLVILTNDPVHPETDVTLTLTP
jgi:hypothetical protein